MELQAEGTKTGNAKAAGESTAGARPRIQENRGKKISHLPKGIFEKNPGSRIYWIRYISGDGKLHRERIGSKEDAVTALASRRDDKSKGKLPKVSKNSHTFSELVGDAIKFLKSERTAAHAYDTGLKFKRMLPTFGKCVAELITRQEVLDWLDEQADEHEWCDATRNRYVAAFSLIYSVAGPEGTKKLESKPWGKITRRQEDNSRVRFLSPAEEAMITAVCRDRYPDYLNVYIFALHTGARASEILRGKVGDYVPETGMITIHQTKDKRKPKTRLVPATPMSIEAYAALAAGKSVGDPLCTNRQGGKLYEMRYWFDPAIKEAGVKDFTFHDLRHTAASRWVMCNVPLAAVAKYLGHSGIQMVMRYSHLQPGVNALAVDAAMSYYPKQSLSLRHD
jgi:integrase